MTLAELIPQVEKAASQAMDYIFSPLGAAVFLVALWYLWYGLRRDFEWKIFSFLYILVCGYVFALFFGGGIYVGRKWNLGPLGAIIGMMAFWGIFEGMTYVKLRLKDKSKRF
jgi:hypothetical protein